MARGDKGPVTKEVVIIHKCFIEGDFTKPSENPDEPLILELPLHTANLLINDKRAVAKKDYAQYLEDQAEKTNRRSKKTDEKVGKGKSGKGKSGKGNESAGNDE